MRNSQERQVSSVVNYLLPELRNEKQSTERIKNWPFNSGVQCMIEVCSIISSGIELLKGKIFGRQL